MLEVVFLDNLLLFVKFDVKISDVCVCHELKD